MASNENTPRHLLPESCFVCGLSAHPARGHVFFSNATADAELRLAPEPIGYSPEAAYVAQHRPY